MKRTQLKFDELNKLEVDYFDPMQISGDDKGRRRELAALLTDAFLFFFMTFQVHREHRSVQTKDYYKNLLAQKIAEQVPKVTGVDSYLSNHIRELASDVVDTTFKNTDKDAHGLAESKVNDKTPLITPPDIPSESGGYSSESEENYWLSYRRADDIGKTEANTFLNYTDYIDAKERGATKKTWLTMLDDKVRNTHEEVEGLTIGIDDLFTVGDSLMRFPHDLSESPDPKEVINCRCAVDYI